MKSLTLSFHLSPTTLLQACMICFISEFKPGTQRLGIGHISILQHTHFAQYISPVAAAA